MRDIKFRVWDGENMISPDYIDGSGNAHWKTNSIPNFSKDFMQYTGLKDRNGHEIYEGDILATDGQGFYDGRSDLATVVSTVNGMGYCLYWEWRVDHYSENGFLQQPGLAFVEVAGNIYENPELLKEEK